MMRKEEILVEVRRRAKENGNKPLGKVRFEGATGIVESDWLRYYWSRFTDMQREAGFEPNQLQGAYSEDYLCEKLISLIRELEAFPTDSQKRKKALNDPDFPQASTFNRSLGNKNQQMIKLLTYCRNISGHDDVVRVLEPFIEQIAFNKPEILELESIREGFVYLVKGSPGHYKIGCTNSVGRRVYELGTKTAIEPKLLHEIKTDDPRGIEKYWHERF